jgi:hypothetical protein
MSSTRKKKLTEAQLEQRQAVGFQAEHGGSGAVRRIGEGKDLVGIARQVELDVYAELETDGRQSIVRRNAARLQAATDLYWSAVEKAAQDNDLKALDHYISRFGWLAGASLRAWAQVKAEEERPGTPVDVTTVLNAVRKGENEENERNS